MLSKYSMAMINNIFNIGLTILIEKGKNKFINLLYEYITFHFVKC